MNQDQDNIRSIKKRVNNIQGVIDFFSIILVILIVDSTAKTPSKMLK